MFTHINHGLVEYLDIKRRNMQNIEEMDELTLKGERFTRKDKERELGLNVSTDFVTREQKQMIETLDYFMQRLSSQQTHQRLQALKGLKLVLSPIGKVLY